MRALKRIWAAFYARNLEFLRDRSTLGWNLMLPFLLMVGLAWLFSGEGRPLYKVGVVLPASPVNTEALVSQAGHLDKDDRPANPFTVMQAAIDNVLHPLLTLKYIDFYPVSVERREDVIQKVARHQADLLLDLREDQQAYWVNPDSPQGYFLEQLLHAQPGAQALRAQSVTGERVRYVDWAVPGILGMNMMFSCLFGVGYVIVRYRKNGYLKRLNATPLTATEFLLAQVFSRLVLVMFTTSLVFAGSHWFLQFVMQGSYLDLFLVMVLGAFTLITTGLLVSARVTSEELAGGLLNLLTWPMMLLSGVWFSMEGAHVWLQGLSRFSPLTHLLEAARAIMLDGASLWDVRFNIGVLLVVALLGLFLGALLFRWRER